MREILFRGKRLDNGEWIYGDVVQFPTHGIVRIVEQEPSYKDAEVDLDTVGQYTGLTDKNGKKIFEGDIFTDGISNYVVTFTNGAFTIDYRPDFLAYFLVSGFADGDIIGNIHDNPELLEEKE